MTNASLKLWMYLIFQFQMRLLFALFDSTTSKQFYIFLLFRSFNFSFLIKCFTTKLSFHCRKIIFHFIFTLRENSLKCFHWKVSSFQLKGKKSWKSDYNFKLRTMATMVVYDVNESLLDCGCVRVAPYSVLLAMLQLWQTDISTKSKLCVRVCVSQPKTWIIWECEK